MNNRRKVVWVIDDEVDLCLLMKAYFLRKNYEVRVSHTCTDVLQALEHGIQPDHVFFDTAICEHPEEIIKTIRAANPGVQIHRLG